MQERRWSWVLTLALLGVACDDPPEHDAPPLFPSLDAAVPGIDGSLAPPPLADAALDASSDGASLAPPAPRVGPVFGVVSSDYTATSVSLLDEQGNVVADDYLHSGSARAGLVTTLSGDVVLPTAAGEPGVLVVIDRFRADVITRVRLADAVVLGQVKTHTPATQETESAYSSNPHDYVALSPELAWVTRAEPNLDPTAPESDRGTDLIAIDLSTMTRTGERIDLSVLNTQGTRENATTQQPEQVDVFARPSRMVRVGNLLVIGLARTAFDFSTYGPGMVAVVDLEARRVSGVELPGLAYCSHVEPVPGEADRVLVGCYGFRRGAAEPRETGGMALLRVADGTAEVVHLYRSAEHPSDPAAFNNVFSLGGTRVAALANGSFATPAMGETPAVEASPDRLLVLDLASGAVLRELFRTEAAFTIGSGLYDPTTQLVLVPDASVDVNGKPTAGVRRFRYMPPSDFEELPLVKVGTQVNMPPRTVRYLSGR